MDKQTRKVSVRFCKDNYVTINQVAEADFYPSSQRGYQFAGFYKQIREIVLKYEEQFTKMVRNMGEPNKEGIKEIPKSKQEDFEIALEAILKEEEEITFIPMNFQNCKKISLTPKQMAALMDFFSEDYIKFLETAPEKE